MSFRYAVVGAGRQGVAAAYDLAKFGEAQEILLIDLRRETAEKAARRVNRLVRRRVARAAQADVRDLKKLAKVLEGTNTFISATPYFLNLSLSQLAVKVGANMCDLGGNTEITRQQLKLDRAAKRAGISIIPDCGMGPGMSISLATLAMSLLDYPEEVFIWDGGLPQKPEPPWNYLLTFNIEGLLNEYTGFAYFLRDGKVARVPCFADYEMLEIRPLGKLEAFVTSGGTSTMPWSYQGKLKTLENKTLRYPGHWAQMTAFKDLGLFETEQFKTLLASKIVRPKVRDVCVIRVKAVGRRKGKRTAVTVELIEYYDAKTGFTAMERITGGHASIMAILATRGQVSPGAIPVELAVPGETVVQETKRRGFKVRVSEE